MNSQQQPKPSPDWSKKTRGGYFGNWFFVQLIRIVGLRAAYVWLIFVAGYFTFASPSAYKASVEFLSRVWGPKPFWKWPFHVYRHFYSFGIMLLDRLAVIMGRTKMRCSFEGQSLVEQHLAQGKGVILLSAHLGAWEIGGHLLGNLGKPVNLVVLQNEENRVRELFDDALHNKNFRLLTTDEHPLRSIPIVAALRRGEIVALHGDRSFGGSDINVPFLGDEASFPIGAYFLAALSGAPIFQVFVVRETIGQYRFFSFPPKLVSKEVLRASEQSIRPYVAEYATRLESVARQYPLQWYNFYPFWRSTPNESVAARHASVQNSSRQ